MDGVGFCRFEGSSTLITVFCFEGGEDSIEEVMTKDGGNRGWINLVRIYSCRLLYILLISFIPLISIAQKLHPIFVITQLLQPDFFRSRFYRPTC